MISICPICMKEYNENPKICTCDYEGIEVYVHEKQEEYWKNQLFHIYKYTKHVYYKRIHELKNICGIEEEDHQILIRDVDAKKGLCVIDLDTEKKTRIDMGILALNRKVRSLIVNVDSIDSDFLDESIVQIVFFGPKVKTFSKGYLRQLSTLKYLFVDPLNESFMSENHVLFNKNKTELICYPTNKNEEEYKVSNHVKVIKQYAFSYPCNLKRLYLPKNIHLEDHAIQLSKNHSIEIIYY